MKIDAIKIARVAMPMLTPFVSACGVDEVIESILIELTSGDDSGWGESAAGKQPTYSAECASTQFTISRDVITPLLLYRDISSGRELQEVLGGIKGNQLGVDLELTRSSARKRSIFLEFMVPRSQSIVCCGDNLSGARLPWFGRIRRVTQWRFWSRH